MKKSSILNYLLFTMLLLGSVVNAFAVSADEARLSEADLKTMITNLGYSSTEGKYSNGTPWYSITYPHAGYDYIINISGGGTNTIWLLAELGTIDKDKQIPQVVLEKMLDANSTATHPYFSFNQNSRELRIKAPIDNDHLTPIRLRAHIQQLVEQMHNTRALWRTEEWPKLLQTADQQQQTVKTN